MKIGRRIYFEKSTGNILLNTGEREVFVSSTTVAQDIENYKELSERNRDTFDVIELEYGAYSQDFATCTGYRVNPETKTLEFSYPDPSAPTEPQPYIPPLSVQVELLRVEMAQSNTELFEMMLMMNGGTA